MKDLVQTAVQPKAEGTAERLLTAEDVGRILAVRTKRVYELGIPAVRISRRSLRWRLSDPHRWLEQGRSS